MILLDIIRLSTTDPWWVTATLLTSRSVVALILVAWVIDMIRAEWGVSPWATRTITWPWALTLFMATLVLAFTAGIARSLLVGHILDFNAVGAAFRQWEMFTSSAMAVTALIAWWRWRRPASNVADSGVFAALFERSPAIVTNHTSVILRATDKLHELGGYPHGSLVGQSLTTIMPERYRAPHLAGLRRYLATGRKVVIDAPQRTPLHMRKADGTEIPIWLKLTSADVHGKPWFLGEIEPRDTSDPEPAENLNRRV